MTVGFDSKPGELLRFRVGPLGPHMQSFAAMISRQGYCRKAGWEKIRLVAGLSRWLKQKRIKLRQLDEHRVDLFLGARYKRFNRRNGDLITMTRLLEHLRESGAVPSAEPVLKTDIDVLAHDYGNCLIQQRALMQATVRHRLTVARRFLWNRFSNGQVHLNKLSAKDVTDFILHASPKCRSGSMRTIASDLRDFLTFLFQQGRITTKLAAAVPTVAPSRRLEPPRFLEPDQVEKLLRSCDRRRKVGKRDYAILLLCARLGLRAGELVNLTLDDIDWRAGELLIRGKGARVDRLPLLHDTGKALADYLQNSRPDSSSRRVFIKCQAPYDGFSRHSTGLSTLVRRAMDRAQIVSPHRGAHVLRHSLATTMLRRGASLLQIGQVLRHQQIQTTTTYAKVDFKALQTLALPWMGGAQ